ncbi:DUF4157 domain-containing protein [Kineosporia mesophila]|nr:DUF4157 domain-containing protein [Kineosporia mesophila]MCD5352038.1 DUF4157 domain-containing protein [Kineosporia mesophila]
MPALQRATTRGVLRSGGRPLDEATRTDMESRLGADFSDVRIHDNSAARRSAAQIQARAYTSGNHVVIGEGGEDRHTLAHELTHVIQQRQGPVAGTDHGGGLRISDPSDRFERAAEANAHRALSGRPPMNAEPTAVQRVSPDMPLQRMVDNRGGTEEIFKAFFQPTVSDNDYYYFYHGTAADNLLESSTQVRGSVVTTKGIGTEGLDPNLGGSSLGAAGYESSVARDSQGATKFGTDPNLAMTYSANIAREGARRPGVLLEVRVRKEELQRLWTRRIQVGQPDPYWGRENGGADSQHSVTSPIDPQVLSPNADLARLSEGGPIYAVQTNMRIPAHDIKIIGFHVSAGQEMDERRYAAAMKYDMIVDEIGGNYPSDPWITAHPHP